LLSVGNNAEALGGFLRGLGAITVKLQAWYLAHHWYTVNAIHQYLWFVLTFLMHYTLTFLYGDKKTLLILLHLIFKNSGSFPLSLISLLMVGGS